MICSSVIFIQLVVLVIVAVVDFLPLFVFFSSLSFLVSRTIFISFDVFLFIHFIMWKQSCMQLLHVSEKQCGKGKKCKQKCIWRIRNMSSNNNNNKESKEKKSKKLEKKQTNVDIFWIKQMVCTDEQKLSCGYTLYLYNFKKSE